jgi:hypothetical protein
MERGTTNDEQETGTWGTKTKMIKDKRRMTTPPPQHPAVNDCSQGGNGDRVGGGTKDNDAGGSKRTAWGKKKKKKKGPRDADVSWAVSEFFFLFSFHFLVTNNKNLR